MNTQKQSAFDALCEQHYKLLTEHGHFGWGIIAVEVAQDEQNALLSQRDALVEVLEGLVVLLDNEGRYPLNVGSARQLLSQIKEGAL